MTERKRGRASAALATGRFVLDVMASGHVFVRHVDDAPREGGLPVYAVGTYEDAMALVTRHCRRANDGTGLYRLTEWPEEPDVIWDLDRVREMFHASHCKRKAK